jgi:uncharacterized protein (TIGR02996 family)
MTERDEEQMKAFKEALKADPYDLAGHMAFADWLSDQGLDEEAAVQMAWTAEAQLASDSFMGLLASRFTVEVKWLIDKGAKYLGMEDSTLAEIMVGSEEEQFWDAYVTITGTPVAQKKRGHFDDVQGSAWCQDACGHSYEDGVWPYGFGDEEGET